MNKAFLLSILTLCILSFSQARAQSCDELMQYVKNEGIPTTYNSYMSDAISQVSFYNVTIDYQSYYFAIVCFKKEYYGCSEYIYQVSSNTQANYGMAYSSSAGKAFWKYIQPHNANLSCGASFN